MPHVGHREPFAERASGGIPAENLEDFDAGTLLAAARSVHRGAWWRAARREGWTRAPGVARAFGILAILACLVAGGGVCVNGPPGLFRGGEMRVGSANRESGRAGPLSPSGMENGAMRAMNMSVAMVAGAMLSTSAAFAQTAVEWKVSDRGNGHWYACLRASSGLSWTAAKQQAERRGGYLATPLTTEENQFIFQLIPAGAWVGIFGPWLGGYQPAGSSEPSGGWSWVTGETWSWTAWRAGEPNNAGGCGGDESALVYVLGTSSWGDAPNSGVCGGNGPLPYFAMEWSADCNGDGIVDYGQILSGELADSNANNIPDCCEQGETCFVNIAVNASFEAGTPLNACSSESVTAGNSIGTGWQVTSGSVQRVRASSSCGAQGTPKFGDFFIDLLDAGEIRQAVATTPGKSYRLTFWLSGDCAGGPTTKRVTAAIGTASQTFDHTCSGSGTQAWRSCSVELIANAAITTLSLKSTVGGATTGPLVDGVRVEDISISGPGDVDGDGSVTGGDVSLVLLNFGDCPSN